MTLVYSMVYPIHKITVGNACRIKITYGGQPLSKIEVLTYTVGSTENVIANLTTNPAFMTLPGPGDYYLLIYQVE